MDNFLPNNEQVSSEDDNRDERSLPNSTIRGGLRWFWLKASAPSILMGITLVLIGAFAAFNAHRQHRGSSEWIVQVLKEVVAIEQLHIQMREIRYLLNIYLRTQEAEKLNQVRQTEVLAESTLQKAIDLIAMSEEETTMDQVKAGFAQFQHEFNLIEEGVAKLTPGDLLPTELRERISHLADQTMTSTILVPLEASIAANGRAAERVVEQTKESARLLSIAYFLLGICGGSAGLFWGIAIARGMYQSMVQLSVSVRGVTGRLSDSPSEVTFTRSGDLPEIKSNIALLESEINRVIEKLQQQEFELLRREQLANVGQLAAGVAHEMRNPLMPMKMLVQSALEQENSKPLSRHSLSILNQEIGRLEGSIQSFLDFARPPALQQENTDLVRIVNDAIELMQPKFASQKIQTVTTGLHGLCFCTIDKNQIRQLLLNLLLNATDAMPNGGELKVALEQTDSPEKFEDSVYDISHPQLGHGNRKSKPIQSTPRLPVVKQTSRRSSKNKQWIILQVVDSGNGIPAHLLERVFEPFVTNKETGTGLGLSICKRIADAHHGYIHATNTQPHGAKFTLLIPRDAL